MKNRYVMDSGNRLAIKRKRKKITPDGRFVIDKDNALNYWLNEPEGWRRENSLPPKIKFTGNWKLDSNYDLEFTLEETKQQHKNDRLMLKGEIISVDADKLVFQLQNSDKFGQTHIHLLKLSGVWQADEFNRLSFEVSKRAKPDTLVFKGVWQINKSQQIIYDYEKTGLKTKDRVLNTLTFRGFWEINSRNRLTYILSRQLNSGFDFRAQLESPNLYPKEGAIKYRVGIGLKSQKPCYEKVVSIFGAWRFNRMAGLDFEVDYGNGRMEAVSFGADVYLTKNDNIAFCLTDKNNQPLGITVVFTHKFLKRHDGEFYLKLKKLCDEAGIEAGVRIPF